jgi:hypothetical protein
MELPDHLLMLLKLKKRLQLNFRDTDLWLGREKRNEVSPSCVTCQFIIIRKKWTKPIAERSQYKEKRSRGHDKF